MPTAPAVRGEHVTVHPPRALAVRQRHAGTVGEPVAPNRLRRLLDAGDYARVPLPSTVVYRMSDGEHVQTGVVLDVSVEDYRGGRIRRHEATQLDRECRLAEYTAKTGFEQVPVLLAHAAGTRLRTLISEVTTNSPEVHLPGGDGLTHTVWVAPGEALAESMREEVAGSGPLYIADGHHRMAAAQRYAGGGRTLAAIYPSDELRVLGYHRCLRRPPHLSTREVLDALGATSPVTRIEPFGPAEAPHPRTGEVTVYLDRRWYRMTLRPPAASGGVRAALDVVALDEGILAPAFGTGDVAEHGRLTPLPGGGDVAEAARWCTEHDAVGFLLHPPSVEDIMAVSDAGQLLPPKSTWFAPKAAAGLLLRELD